MIARLKRDALVPNNSIERQIVQKQIIVQCEKVTSIFVFFNAKTIFYSM